MKNMSDSLMKALAYNNEVRIYVVDATGMVEEACKLHGTWNTATAALGRAMIGTTLLSATLKNENDKLTVRIHGDGPLGYMVIDGNMHGHIKAYVNNPEVSLELNEKAVFVEEADRIAAIEAEKAAQEKAIADKAKAEETSTNALLVEIINLLNK